MPKKTKLKKQKGGIVVIDAEFTKETKTTWRFQLMENDHGVSGSLYLNKDTHPEVDDIIKVKIKLHD